MMNVEIRRVDKMIDLEKKRTPGGIEVKNLQVTYNTKQVLHGIDLVFPPGKVTAIIGPSGCGKTSLLRCLNRLSELNQGCKVSGQILLDGEDVFGMDPTLLRQKVGMVFQKPNPFPKSIKENVLYGVKAIKLKCDHDAVVKSCLEKAALWEELKERLRDSAFALSVGQQQRLCIARSLAISPEVILLDEPASALDPISTTTLENSILEMKGEYTQIIVTHNMNEALKVSDYVAFMYMGKLIEFGETKKIFNSPDKHETRDYITGKVY
ncbi:MAG: phosphate ABC transporter ATP-binding protein [Dehalococcoidales bacterium]